MKSSFDLRVPIFALGLLAGAAATGAAAQAAPEQPNLTIPAQSRTPATDIRVTKTATGSGYEIVIANYGSESVTGIVVVDRVDATCPATNPVAVTSGPDTEGRFTIADLTGAGIVLSTLTGDEIATLKFECKGN